MRTLNEQRLQREIEYLTLQVEVLNSKLENTKYDLENVIREAAEWKDKAKAIYNTYLELYMIFECNNYYVAKDCNPHIYNERRAKFKVI